MNTDIAIIGAGLIGSAAARHLADAGANVTLVGVAEGNLHGVYASHYDQARITRQTDPDPIWAALASDAVARYPEIEARSGIVFHDPVGHVRSDHPLEHKNSVLKEVRCSAETIHPTATEHTSQEARTLFPFLHFAAGSVIHVESAPAGLINPRQLVAAQQTLVADSGGQLVREAALRVRAAGEGFSIQTTGPTITTRRVLVCAGPHTNDFALTPTPLPLDVRPETVLLVETSPPVRAQLTGMPGVIWSVDRAPIASYAYILPPTRYPDERYYLKIGADNDRDQDVSTLGAKRRYMQTAGSQSTAAYLREMVDELIPLMKNCSSRTMPCLLTYTPSGYPLVDELAPGWFVATGGCGKAAKSSDQIGKLAADLVLGRDWPRPFKQEAFRSSSAAG